MKAWFKIKARDVKLFFILKYQRLQRLKFQNDYFIQSVVDLVLGCIAYLKRPETIW